MTSQQGKKQLANMFDVKIHRDLYTAKSKKVVPQKSKIPITKYKIQEIVCHITHKSGLTTSSPCDTLYEEVFSVNSEEIPRDICLHLKHNTTYFELILCILEFRFCIFEGQPFFN